RRTGEAFPCARGGAATIESIPCRATSGTHSKVQGPRTKDGGTERVRSRGHYLYFGHNRAAQGGDAFARKFTAQCRELPHRSEDGGSRSLCGAAADVSQLHADGGRAAAAAGRRFHGAREIVAPGAPRIARDFPTPGDGT